METEYNKFGYLIFLYFIICSNFVLSLCSIFITNICKSNFLNPENNDYEKYCTHIKYTEYLISWNAFHLSYRMSVHNIRRPKIFCVLLFINIKKLES